MHASHRDNVGVPPGRCRSRRVRRGNVLVMATMMLSVFIGFAAFSVDVSRARSAKSELQAAADAAALNAAKGLGDSTHVVKAQAAALENKCDGTAVVVPAANVTAGNWTGTAFVANGTPRNAVRVIASRSRANGTGLSGTLSQTIGLIMPDISATSTVAVSGGSPYEWTGVNGINLSAGSSNFRVTAYDSTNGAAGQSLTTIRTNGSIMASGAAYLNADLRYGGSALVSGATVVGTRQQVATPATFATGLDVAAQHGYTLASPTPGNVTFASNQTLPGGTYYFNNISASGCNVTFGGPTVIVMTGSLNLSNARFTTSGGQAKNLKIVATNPGGSFNISNPTGVTHADIYAPESTLYYSSSNASSEIRGRGVFKSMNMSGSRAGLWYDKNLAVTSPATAAKSTLVR